MSQRGFIDLATTFRGTVLVVLSYSYENNIDLYKGDALNIFTIQWRLAIGSPDFKDSSNIGLMIPEIFGELV